jgi:LPXTG-site transpeptidase (sortase) family protein
VRHQGLTNPAEVTSDFPVRRAIAAGLVLAAAAVGFRIWSNEHHFAEHKAAVAAPVPSDLTPRSHEASAATTTTTQFLSSATSSARSAKSTHPAVVTPIVPTHLFIPAIGVNTTVTAKPSNSQWDEFLGKNVDSFGVPPDMYTTTWWSASAQGTPEPRPGSAGMAIMLGHTQIGAYGVFNDLGQLKPGQLAGVSSGKVTLTFQVLAVKRDIPKTDAAALSRVLGDHPQTARLALITCSGHFNGRESVDNTVVFLQLVGTH